MFTIPSSWNCSLYQQFLNVVILEQTVIWIIAIIKYFYDKFFDQNFLNKIYMSTQRRELMKDQSQQCNMAMRSCLLSFLVNQTAAAMSQLDVNLIIYIIYFTIFIYRQYLFIFWGHHWSDGWPNVTNSFFYKNILPLMSIKRRFACNIFWSVFAVDQFLKKSVCIL